MEHGPTSSSPLEFEGEKDDIITLKLQEVFDGWKMVNLNSLKVLYLQIFPGLLFIVSLCYTEKDR